VSSSNDQRVKEWSVSVKEGRGVELERVGDVFTSVADVGDLAVLRNGVEGDGGRKVLVVGNGMDVWGVSLQK